MQTLNDVFAEFEKKGRISLRVKVIPRSAGNAIVGLLADGTLKVRVAAEPEKGRANNELKKFLADEFDTQKENVTILAGSGDALKMIRLEK